MRYLNSRLTIKRKDARQLISRAFDVLNASRSWFNNVVEPVLEVEKQVAQIRRQRLNDALVILEIMLDHSDREVLYNTIAGSQEESFEKVSVDLDDSEKFREWLIKASMQYQISLDTFDPTHRVITFSVIPL